MSDISLHRPQVTSEKQPSNFMRFLEYVRPYKHYVAAGAIGGIVKFSVPLIVPRVTQFLVDDVYLNQTLNTADKISQLLISIGILAAIFIFFWSPLTYIRHYYAGLAGQRSVFDLRCDLYYHILRMSPSFFDRNQSGGIVARLISDIEQAQNLVGSALTNIWMDMFSLVLILYFMLTIDVHATGVALITFPIYIYMFRHLNNQIRETSHQVQEEIATLSGNVQEKITGNRVVHAFVQEKNEEKHFYDDSEKVFESSMRRIYYQSLNMTITGVIVNLAPLIVTIYGGYRVIEGSMTVGQLVALGMYLTPLYTPLQRFSELNIVYSNSMAALDRVFEIMDEKPEIRNRANAVPLVNPTGSIQFENAHFTYDNIDAPGAVLEDINLEIQPGEKVAFVGPSGAGKSTVVSLIPRFYDVDAGCVKIDGQDVRTLKLKSLRSHVGMVLQSPILFSGSVVDNIRYGRPTATMKEVVAACKAANAYDFIQSLPGGFGFNVGENGTFLSGGQKQRMTIARAFLKDPRILILDEATSALDSESERLIQAALERLMIGRTTLIIAHRLSTIVNADKIVVMEKGRIIQVGKHDELIEVEGMYRSLYL